MKTKAFTLVELLLVLVIIGILAVIVYPNFERFKTRARLKEVENTVELIRAAERVYYFKTGDWHYFSKTGTGNGSATGSPASYTTAETNLNITLPSYASSGTICNYTIMDDSGQVIIRFASNDDDEAQGDYVLEDTTAPANVDTYDVDSYNGKWEPYLLYLE